MFPNVRVRISGLVFMRLSPPVNEQAFFCPSMPKTVSFGQVSEQKEDE